MLPNRIYLSDRWRKTHQQFSIMAIGLYRAYFTDTLWPDFDARALDLAIQSYQQRERRFGVPANNFKRCHPFMGEETLSSKKRHSFYAFPIRAVSSLPSIMLRTRIFTAVIMLFLFLAALFYLSAIFWMVLLLALTVAAPRNGAGSQNSPSLIPSFILYLPCC